MRQRLRRVKSLRARLVNQQFGTSEDLLALLARLETISQAGHLQKPLGESGID